MKVLIFGLIILILASSMILIGKNPGQNFEIIRYADILLLYSELTGDATYLNQVRARAGLPFMEVVHIKKYNNLALAVEHERRVGLAFEFHRFLIW